MVNVGGFFASLKLISDSNSFEKGKKDILGFSKNIWTAVAAIGAMTAAVSILERRSLLMARSANMSAESYGNWSIAASNMGANAEGLIQSIGALDNKFQQLKLGQVDENLAKNLSFLGVGYTQAAGMTGEQRTSTILGSALGMQDERKAAELVGQVLGESGREFFWYVKMSGRSLNDVLQEAKGLNFTTAETKKNAMLFAHELSSVKNGLESIGKFAFSQIAKQLTPLVSKFKEWIILHKQMITGGIDRFINNLVYSFRVFVPLFDSLKEIGKGFLSFWRELPQQIKGTMTIVSLLRTGPIGQLIVAFLFIQDIVQYLSGGPGKTMIGDAIRGFGTLFGDLHLDEDVRKSFEGFFNWLSSTVDGIAKNIKYLMDQLKQLPQTLDFMTNQEKYKTQLAPMTAERLSKVQAVTMAQKFTGLGGKDVFLNAVASNPALVDKLATVMDEINEYAIKKTPLPISTQETSKLLQNQTSVNVGGITLQVATAEDRAGAAWLVKKLGVNPNTAVFIQSMMMLQKK